MRAQTVRIDRVGVVAEIAPGILENRALDVDDGRVGIRHEIDERPGPLVDDRGDRDARPGRDVQAGTRNQASHHDQGTSLNVPPRIGQPVGQVLKHKEVRSAWKEFSGMRAARRRGPGV